MMNLWSRLSDILEDGEPAVVVTVLSVDGSAPREPGARMVVRRDGGFHGTIGGGTLEWHALAAAQKLIRTGEATAQVSRHALGPEMGQCCGGVVRLLLECFVTARVAEVRRLAEIEASGRFTTIGRVNDTGVVRQVVDHDNATSQSCNLLADGSISENFGDEGRPVYLFGAGHVGRALILAMAPLPFRVTWIDPRPDAFPRVAPGNVSQIQSGDMNAIIAAAPSNAMVLILTHSHALDLEIAQLALSANRFAYVGLIGSKTKRARFTNRLVEAGIPRTRIEADLVCPIGLKQINSKEPAVLAAGVVADLLVRSSALAQNICEDRHVAGGHG